MATNPREGLLRHVGRIVLRGLAPSGRRAVSTELMSSLATDAAIDHSSACVLRIPRPGRKRHAYARAAQMPEERADKLVAGWEAEAEVAPG
jgi:hypothetical protein